ncbi:hypothetical protein K1719_003061 [Acacia pycnantha]|nr:hypothetical protein K1719_003061 [Acacia pycnantha]
MEGLMFDNCNGGECLAARVTITCPEKGDVGGRLVLLPKSLKELIEIGVKKFGLIHDNVEVQNKEGAQIDDIEVVRDGDYLVFVSVGGLMRQSSCSAEPHQKDMVFVADHISWDNTSASSRTTFGVKGIFVAVNNSIDDNSSVAFSRNLVAWDGSSRLYFWEPNSNCLHNLSLRLGEPEPTSILAASPSKVLRADMEISFAIHKMSINRNGLALLLFGSERLCGFLIWLWILCNLSKNIICSPWNQADPKVLHQCAQLIFRLVVTTYGTGLVYLFCLEMELFTSFAYLFHLEVSQIRIGARNIQ